MSEPPHWAQHGPFQLKYFQNNFNWKIYPSLNIFAKFDVVGCCDGVKEKNWNEDEVFINLIFSLTAFMSLQVIICFTFTCSEINPLEERKRMTRK